MVYEWDENAIDCSWIDKALYWSVNLKSQLKDQEDLIKLQESLAKNSQSILDLQLFVYSNKDKESIISTFEKNIEKNVLFI